MPPVVVLVTTASGAADEVSLQALTLGRRIAAGGPVHALVLADEAAAAGLGDWGATEVHVARHAAFTRAAPDAAARVLGDLADQVGAAAVLGPGTEAGNTILARVAARAGLPFAANCTALTLGAPTTLTRSRWGGSLLEEAALHADRAIVTTAPHAIAAEPVSGVAAPAPAATVTPFDARLDEADLAVRVVDRVPAAAGGLSLAEAKVVVSGGRGVGSAEGFRPVEELAGLLGAAVGCSRAVTISGWRSHTDQVGQTGTKIAPNLYIAAGISGATQHLAGARGAKKILAINKDAEAPIMAAADYAVIGDLHAILPAISAEIRRARGA
ncbi:MAG TPA: electron transfer flavoprotein subunit alpha/FixB family protein [Candidatus Limnocylindrales bacterium]|nr:electron transfer flavoprotein subunit alpha/FixB family protein [Candidatus Limnocylindrales bacterium]